jgi:hypothetical protein
MKRRALEFLERRGDLIGSSSAFWQKTGGRKILKEDRRLM